MLPKLRLVTFSCSKNAQSRVGILLDNKSVVDLSATAKKSAFQSMLQFIDDGKKNTAEAKNILKSPPSHSIINEKDVTIKAPIPLPRRNVFCIGKNYIDHVAEVQKASTANIGTGSPADGLPKFPIFFTKAPECVIPSKDYIESHNTFCKSLDYEAELAVIIGTGGRDISAANAMSHVFGYSIANDVTARDIQKKHNQWFKGKTLDRTCPMGPCIVSAEDLDASDLSIGLWLNGVKKQDSRTSKMIFDIPAIIASLSEGFTLNPGDIILTGTPDGVGFAVKPIPRTLLPGDHVRIEIEHIGTLENDVKE